MCMKKPHFPEKMRFCAGQRSIIFSIYDAGDDGEFFAEVFIFFLVILSIADLLALTRFQCQADGLLVRESKTGKRVLICWTDELKRVVDDCLQTSPDVRLFPITESAVNNAWGHFQRSLAADGRARFLLRDLRAKHASDLEDAGGNATTQLGHSTRAVTARHYLRAPRRIVPIK